MTLPPLPLPAHTFYPKRGKYQTFSADQMRAYGEACAAAERGLVAEPQGEPVAWMHDGFVSTNFERVKHDESRNRASGFKAKPIIPLYTHPPQRQPLTDEQIKAIWWQCESTIRDHDPRHVWWSQFARAIERAHGIGEAP